MLQVSYAITASARQAVGDGDASKASPRKRPRTDNGGTEAAAPTESAFKLFVEQPSPIALAKAIKNKVWNPCCSSLRALPPVAIMALVCQTDLSLRNYALSHYL